MFKVCMYVQYFLFFLFSRPIIVKGISGIPGFIDYKFESMTKLKENEINMYVRSVSVHS